MYIVYCDGAYSHNRKQGGSGLIIFKNGKPVFEYSKTFQGGSNNTAELCAIILALKCFKNPVDSIVIVSDSQYCIGIINKKWRINSNIELWKEFVNVYKKTKKICNKIKFVWTRGHTGYNKAQERADYLAVRASQAVDFI